MVYVFLPYKHTLAESGLSKIAILYQLPQGLFPQYQQAQIRFHLSGWYNLL